MLTIDRYITRVSNRSILAVVVALASLISLFAFFEEMDESQVTYGLMEAATYVLQTMPRRIDEILVFGLFLGYLIALGRFAESNELTIFRASGMSPLRLCGALAPSMGLWLILSLFLSEYIAPLSERTAEADKLQAKFGEDALNNQGGLWVRDGQMFMQVQAIDEQGNLQRIRQYWLDASDQLIERVQADSGHYNSATESWLLRGVTKVKFSGGSATQTELQQWRWQNPMSPDLLAAQAFLEPSKMSIVALYRQIQFASEQYLAVSEYELAFWTRLFKPLTFMGLTLFALAVVLGPLREVSMGLRLTFGVFAGLGFKYLQDLFAPAAIVFEIPAVIAILLPIAIYWIIAWMIIQKNA